MCRNNEEGTGVAVATEKTVLQRVSDTDVEVVTCEVRVTQGNASFSSEINLFTHVVREPET